MIETFNIAEGPVYEGCSCVEGEPLPQPASILPADCYSPDGTDCSWYGRCLAARYPCTGHQAEYAVSYGAKFCDLHVSTTDQFSPPTVTWINSVRKCLQVELVPLLRLCRRPPTCEEIRKTAFQSHQPCYFNPYGGFSVCKIPPDDWLRVFWTLKNAFLKTFVESFKTFFIAARTCGPDYQHRLGQLVYVLELRPSNLAAHSVKVRRAVDLVLERLVNDEGGVRQGITDDELAHAVMLSISEQLHWETKTTVGWYAFALPQNDSDNELIAIQLLVVDLVDIGLMDVNESLGRTRLNDAMRQFSDVISAGIAVDIKTTSGSGLTVMSLRRCDSDVTGCSNGSVVARRGGAQRPRAVITSSNDAVTSSTWRTVARMSLVCLCFLSLCLNRLRFTDFDSQSDCVRVRTMVRRTTVL